MADTDYEFKPLRICDNGEVNLQGLLPCPFCGGQYLSVKDGSTYRWWTLYCGECEATCGDCDRRGDDAPEQLRKAWNTRGGVEPKEEPKLETSGEPGIFPIPCPTCGEPGSIHLDEGVYCVEHAMEEYSKMQEAIPEPKRTVWVVPDCDALVNGNESVEARTLRLHSSVTDAKLQFPEGFMLLLTPEALEALFPGEELKCVGEILGVKVKVRGNLDE